MRFPIKFNTTNSKLKVGGDMSEKGSDIVGIIIASSGLVLALAVGVAIVLLAIHHIQKG